MTRPNEPLLSRLELIRQLRTRFDGKVVDALIAEGMPVACYTPSGRPRFLRSQVDEWFAERARIAARQVGAA